MESLKKITRKTARDLTKLLITGSVIVVATSISKSLGNSISEYLFGKDEDKAVG